jgi:hypothetical protein
MRIKEWNRVESKLRDMSSFPMSAKKSFLLLAGIYMVGISAILRANFNYIDDMARVLYGYWGWANFSRYLSIICSCFIHADTYLTDVSPLPQLIAAAIMALSGVVLLVILYGRTQFTIIEILALVPFGLNPYFLQCMSYKYDSPYMALSVFCAIFPLLFRKKRAVVYIAVSFIGTLAVCTSYQASTGIYPILVILIMLRMWNNKEENIGQIAQFCIRSVVGYSVGILTFRIFLMKTFDTHNGTYYVSSELPGIRSFIPNFFQNLGKYYSLVQSDFKWWWLVIALLLVVGFIWTMFVTSKQNPWIGMLVSVLALVCMGILCFGLYAALTKPSFDPRTMYGFGILLTLLSATIAEQKKDLVIKVPVIMIGWVFFVFAFTYGNALYVQKEYTDFRITQVIEDLNDLEIFTTGEPVTVQIAGSIGYSQVIDNMPQNYQMLNRLVPMTFGDDDWWWGTYGFYHYYGLKNVVLDRDIDLTTYDLPVIEDHIYHTIRGKDNYILIELK